MDGASWSLPTTAVIGGREYHLNTDYRDILEILLYLENEPDTEAGAHIALALFYEEYDTMPPQHWVEAVHYLEGFLNCFEPETGKPQPKSFDWEQDYGMIVADVNKAAGCEVRALEYMHWFTFIAHFMSVGEGQLSTLVSVRQKVRKGQKLEKWEQEYYRQHKSRVDLKTRCTPEEQAEIDRLNALLGG